MKPLLSSKPGTASEAQRTGRTETGMDEECRTAAAPGPLASFARFVLCGGGVGLASGPAVALLAALMPWALANALVTAASTILCTQLHARFTFGAGPRAGWRQHWQSAGSASAAYTVTCAAMFILHMVQPSAGTLSEQAVYLSASGLAGIGRFLVLRRFVFADSRTMVHENSPTEVQEASGTVSWSIAPPAWPKVMQSPSEPSCPGRRRRRRCRPSGRALDLAVRSVGVHTPTLHSPVRPRHPQPAGTDPGSDSSGQSGHLYGQVLAKLHLQTGPRAARGFLTTGAASRCAVQQGPAGDPSRGPGCPRCG
jgi:putative flippase GtrA